jgi:hypothetical protein
VHRASVHTVRTTAIEKPPLLGQCLSGLLLLGYFTLLPVLTSLAVNWVVYYFTARTWFHDEWMMPTLLLFSTFVGGVFIRQKIEDEEGGLALFLLGMFGLIIFAYVTDLDIHRLGGVYSQYMPKFLRPTMVQYVCLLPGVGVCGMLFYKFFSVKNYK